MKTGLIILGIIFLVLGAMLYFVPMQEFEADTTTTNGGNTDTRTSSASVSIPVVWAFASLMIGLISLILGVAIPSSNRRSNGRRDRIDDGRKGDSRRDSRGNVIESKRNIKSSKRKK